MKICSILQIEEAIKTKGKGNLNKLLSGRETWTINACKCCKAVTRKVNVETN